MANRLPFIPGNHKICIICEGNEEYEYLNRLKDEGERDEYSAIIWRFGKAPVALVK